MATESLEILEPHTVDSSLESLRTEIDTSAPFESVKEAASRFGGMGFWKPISHKPSEHASQRDDGVVNVIKLEEEAAQLERDLITKERETLHVLKELESTKNVVEELKLKLQNEASEITAALKENPNVNSEVSKEEGKFESDRTVHQSRNDGLSLCPSSAPGFILLELKQAKLNLTKATNYIADIRATVDMYSKKIEEERASLEKTRKRLSCNTQKISSMEEELDQTGVKLAETKDTTGSVDSSDITKQLQQLGSETERFRKVGQAAKSQVQRAMSEIEQTKARIKTAEMSLIAAKRMKDAARASERVALAEIRALSKSKRLSEDVVTLTFEEYSSLISKARESEQACRRRVENAMLEVDEANVSKTEILRKVEEATEEVKISKKALEEALSRVEVANREKLAVEDALRVWRSEHGHNKRRAVRNAVKFKTSHSFVHRKEPQCCLRDANGLNLVNDEARPVLKPTLSIGQILSRKLMLTEEYERGLEKENVMGKCTVSLGQMLLSKKCERENEEIHAKRKRFGIARISLLVAKQSLKKKKKKKKSLSASSMCA